MAHAHPPTVVFSFDSLAAASRTRDELLERGFSPQDLHLRVVEDEAGPVQGNWVVGNGVETEDPQFPGLLAGREHAYAANFSRTVHRGTSLLQVNPQDEDARRCAADAAARHGGVDVRSRADASAPGPAARD